MLRTNSKNAFRCLALQASQCHLRSTSLPVGTDLHFMAPWIPSLAVSNLLITPMADCFSVCLTPSPTAIKSLFRAPTTNCRMLLWHRCEPSVLTPKSVFDELLLVTILMTPQAKSQTPYYSTAFQLRFTRTSFDGSLLEPVSRQSASPVCSQPAV